MRWRNEKDTAIVPKNQGMENHPKELPGNQKDGKETKFPFEKNQEKNPQETGKDYFGYAVHLYTNWGIVRNANRQIQAASF